VEYRPKLSIKGDCLIKIHDEEREFLIALKNQIQVEPPQNLGQRIQALEELRIFVDRMEDSPGLQNLVVRELDMLKRWGMSFHSTSGLR
jgi:hypothetical protein